MNGIYRISVALAWFIALATASLPVWAQPAAGSSADVPSTAASAPPASAGSAPPAVDDLPGGDPLAKSEQAKPSRGSGYAAELTRATPRDTVAGFLREVRRGQTNRAAQYMDLQGLRWDHHTPAEAATALAAVLETRLWLQVEAISDVPEGTAGDGDDFERLGVLEVDDLPVGIGLTRMQGPAGQRYWVFSRSTVAALPSLNRANELRWYVQYLPEEWRTTVVLGFEVWRVIGFVGAFLLGIPLGYLIGRVLGWVLARVAARTPNTLDDQIVAKSRSPLRFVCEWLMFGFFVEVLDLWDNAAWWFAILFQTPLILATGWFLATVVHAVTHVIGENAISSHLSQETRGMRTQLVMLRKLTILTISLITVAIVLLQFDVVQSMGVSLLASAGVAGVALGFAAQKSLGAVIAGIQLSFTQPIRLEDIVVIGGHWGQVEQINLTFVQLKLNDERRLIVPIEQFLNQHFENWSKPGNEMVALVEFAVDPMAPVDRMRAEVLAFAEEHKSYDGREAQLQLVDLSEHRMLLRARVSTNDAEIVFEMRCDLRERLVGLLQSLGHGAYFPRARWELRSDSALVEAAN